MKKILQAIAFLLIGVSIMIMASISDKKYQEKCRKALEQKK